MSLYLKNIDDAGHVIMGENASYDKPLVVCKDKSTDGKVLTSSVVPEQAVQAISKMRFQDGANALEKKVKKFTLRQIAGTASSIDDIKAF